MAERDRWGRIPVKLIEIDQPFCKHTYGSSPCAASIGTTGSDRCYNTLGTCQDTENFDSDDSSKLTLRFSPDDQVTPADFAAIPSVSSVRQQPARLSVGGTNEDVSPLGARATLTVTFLDHPSSDLQTDPYVDQRSYEPMERGTFWGKWLARNVYRQNMPVRFISGYLLEDGSVEVSSTYHYLLEKVDGPDSSGKVTLKAYDLLRSLRADRAVFPEPSPGRLAADIDESATAILLKPSGIGQEYPLFNFRLRVGGEGFDVYRPPASDILQINTRGLYGGLESHSEDDSAQVVARLSGQVHDIANEIITTAIPELSGNIDKPSWDGIADEYLPRIYQADITEPTGVEDLLAELVQTAPVYWYADIRTNMIVMDAIREPTDVAVEINESSHIRKNSLSLSEFPKERIDEVWIYYRMRDPAGDVDDDKNYSQRYILVNADEQDKRGRRSVKRIYSRWIQAGARDAAEEIAQAYISRFQNPPIRVSFDLDAKDGEIWLGNVAKIISRQKQDATGAPRSDLNYQIIEAEEKSPGSVFSYMAQSYEFFSPVDPDNLVITIQPEDTTDGSGNVDQIDLRALYDSVVATEVPNITFIVAGGPGSTGGTVAGAGAGQSWSVNVPNNWPWSPAIKLRVESGGVVAGRAGSGGKGADVSGDADGAPGGNGQTGLMVRYAIELDNDGIIGGGGGGGGGSACNQNSVVRGGGGGGGAGRVAGQRGPGGSEPSGYDFYVYTEATSGALLTGGKGGYTDNESNGSTNIFQGGDGGNLGQPGQPGQTVNGGASPGGNGGAGGAAGNAIDGDSYITYINAGDIRGAII